MEEPTDLHSIPGLVQRLRSSRRVEQARTATAIDALLTAEAADERRAEVVTAIVAAGGVPPLVQRLGSSSGVAVHRAAAAVLRDVLCRCSEENRAAVIAAGSPPALARLLQHSSSTDALTAATDALGNLSTTASGSQAVQQAGAVPALVGLLRHAEPVVQVAAANTLCGLSLPGRCGTEVVAAGGLPALLHALQDGTAAYVQERAAAALGNLALAEGAGDSHRQAVMDADGIAALVPCLCSRDAGLRETATNALCALTNRGGDAARAAVLAAGGPEILAQLLLEGERQPAPVLLLDNLVFDNLQFCQRLAAAGGLAPLIDCACSGTGPAQSAAMRSLLIIADMVPQLRPRLVAAGTVEALQHVLQDAADKDMKEMTAIALAALQKQPAGSGPTAEAAQPPPQQAPARSPPRVCAAPGCGATAGLRRCGGCGTVRYCSEACSRAHWRAHKAECRRLQAERAAAAAAAACGQ